MTTAIDRQSGKQRWAWVLAGCWLLIALIGNEYLLGVLATGRPLNLPAAVWAVRGGQLVALVMAALSFLQVGCIKQLHLAMASLALVVITLEGMFRVMERQERLIAIDKLRLRIPDAYLHHTLAPGIAAWDVFANRRTRYYTNPLGFRSDATNAIERVARDRYRILFLGDSFCEGVAVDEPEIFYRRFQQALPADIRTEVLNGGVVSYFPRLHLRKLRRFLSQGYRADLVVMLVDISDVHDATDPDRCGGWDRFTDEQMAGFQAERAKKLARLNNPRAGGLRAILQPRLFAGIQALRSRRTPKSWDETARNLRFRWPGPPDLRREHPWIAAGLTDCAVDIVAAKQLCEGEGIPFVLVIYPHPPQLLNAAQSNLHETCFSELAAQEHIQLVNLYPVFRGHPDWRTCFIPGDVHWNADGHRVVGLALARELDALIQSRYGEKFPGTR